MATTLPATPAPSLTVASEMLYPAIRRRRRLRQIALAFSWLVAIGLVMLGDQRLERLFDSFAAGVTPLYYLSFVFTDLIKIIPLSVMLVLLTRLDLRLRRGFLRVAAWVMLPQMFASSLLKHLFGRLRPPASDHETIFLGPGFSEASYSFPSGHATAAFALAALLTAYYPRWRYLFWVVAALAALARVQLDRHFFSDIFAGGILGWYMAWWFIGWQRQRAQASAEVRVQVGASPMTEPPPVAVYAQGERTVTDSGN